MSSADAGAPETLFWELAQELLAEPAVTRSTMMGYPCLRSNGAFFACIEKATGNLIVKLPARRVSELTSSGQALPFAPSGRTFREWAAFPGCRPRRMAGAAHRSPRLHRRLMSLPGSTTCGWRVTRETWCVVPAAELPVNGQG